MSKAFSSSIELFMWFLNFLLLMCHMINLDIFSSYKKNFGITHSFDVIAVCPSGSVCMFVCLFFLLFLLTSVHDWVSGGGGVIDFRPRKCITDKFSNLFLAKDTYLIFYIRSKR